MTKLKKKSKTTKELENRIVIMEDKQLKQELNITCLQAGIVNVMAASHQLSFGQRQVMPLSIFNLSIFLNYHKEDPYPKAALEGLRVLFNTCEEYYRFFQHLTESALQKAYELDQQPLNQLSDPVNNHK